MRVLVAYGSKMGGTAGIADTITATLKEAGFSVDELVCDAVESVGAYDAVIVGGALYMMRWHADARRFIKRFDRALRERPVWFFSSGPLDATALAKDIPPVRGVKHLMAAVGARGHMTFGGRLVPDAEGFLARRMARKTAGDWRDQEQITKWASSVATALQTVGAVT